MSPWPPCFAGDIHHTTFCTSLTGKLDQLVLWGSLCKTTETKQQQKVPYHNCFKSKDELELVLDFRPESEILNRETQHKLSLVTTSYLLAMLRGQRLYVLVKCSQRLNSY